LDKSFLIGGNMKNRVLLSLLLLTLAACKVQTGTDESSQFKVFSYADSQVNFAVIKENVLVPQCLQCHSWSTNETEFNKRIVAGNPELSEVYKMLKSGQMPSGKPRLTNQSLQLVEQYIIHVNSNAVPKPIPLAPTYSSLKVNIFEKSCIRCHNPDVLVKHPKRPLFTSKEAIVAKYKDIIYSVTDAWMMNDNEMPPEKSKIPRLTDEEINMLKEWQQSGFQD
jgi:mono/diheme cytochrome c family protein